MQDICSVWVIRDAFLAAQILDYGRGILLSFNETQLTITNNPLTKAGTLELETLFGSLCKELNAEQDSITALTIAASADTMEQLENMGY